MELSIITELAQIEIEKGASYMKAIELAFREYLKVMEGKHE